MTLDITVVTPTIPPRVGPGGLLEAAMDSVRRQTLPPTGGISIALDVDHVGAAVTRQRALDAVRTEWVAFLDDDDTLYPNHLETLARLVVLNQADYVWSWFDGNNPFPMHRGRQLDLDAPHHTTMTVMVRTEVAKEAGFYQSGPLHQDWAGEDWQFTLRCIEVLRRRYGDNARHRFAGTGDVTWTYRVHGKNTSGLGARW